MPINLLDDHEPSTGAVIDTVIEVLDALAAITIADIESIEKEERGLQTIKARIHLITNILDARKLRRPILVQRHG